MRQVFKVALILLLLSTPALAHRKARTVVDEGKPIDIWVHKGTRVYLVFPESIVPFDAPVNRTELALTMADGSSTTLIAESLELQEPVMMSIPTLGGIHIINFRPHKSNGDTHVTMTKLDPAQVQKAAEASLSRMAREADEAPLISGMARMFHAMYGEAGTGVSRMEVRTLLSDTPEERQTIVWRYRKGHLMGHTILVENRRPVHVTIHHAGLRDVQQGEGFYASSLSTTSFEPLDSIAPGGSGYLHLVYIGARPATQ